MTTGTHRAQQDLDTIESRITADEATVAKIRDRLARLQRRLDINRAARVYAIGRLRREP